MLFLKTLVRGVGTQCKNLNMVKDLALLCWYPMIKLN